MLVSSLFDVNLPYQLLPCEVSFFINQCKCNSLTYSLFVNVFVSLDTGIFISQCISLLRVINGQWWIFIETWKNVEREPAMSWVHIHEVHVSILLVASSYRTGISSGRIDLWLVNWLFSTIHASLPVSLLIELVPVGYSTWLQLYLLLHESKNIDHYNPDPKAKISNFPENMKVTMNLFHCFCFMFACSVNFLNR